MARKPIVLIVEDNPTMRKTLARVVEMEDMDVLTAARAHGVLKMVKEHNPDAIILDVDLGKGANGIDLLRAIKRHPKYASTPVILHTSESGISTVQESQLADLTIIKPADPDELVVLIKRVLHARRSQQHA